MDEPIIQDLEDENEEEEEEEEENQNPRRRNVVPIIYTRGTHYDIGYDIGKTFAEMIRNYVNKYVPLHATFLPLYETPEGKNFYDETLAFVEEQYPHYVREMRGTADGSGVPFHELFLMHMHEMLPMAVENFDGEDSDDHAAAGCTAIVCNRPGQEILGHNVEALYGTLNHWYLVDAHVIEPGLPEEKFCSLCYAGFLPGFTMGYNHHGLVYSVNTLERLTPGHGKTPRNFLGRALLGAKNYHQVDEILRNENYGAANGFAVNFRFQQDKDRIFYNIEVGHVVSIQHGSPLDILTAGPGEYFHHCNKYLRIEEIQYDHEIASSIQRELTIRSKPPPENVQDVIEILSDQSDANYPLYRDDMGNETIATGIFDFVAKTWSIYVDKPNSTQPIVELPLKFKNDLMTT